MPLSRFVSPNLLIFLFLCNIGIAWSAPIVVGRSVVLPGKEGKTLLHQCSRRSPQGIGKAWSPSTQDIRTMETAIPTYLRSQKLPATVQASRLQNYYHQCVGFLRAGHHVIYINAFSPAIKADMDLFDPLQSHKKPFDWKRDPVSVCDGGPSFFGVEYDVDAKQFLNLSFNGIG